MRPKSENFAFVLRVWIESDDPVLRGHLVSVEDGAVATARGQDNLLALVASALRDLPVSSDGDAAATGL